MPTHLLTSSPNTVFRNIMTFIDGENLAMRYKAMKDMGLTPCEGVRFEEDIFVWIDSLQLIPPCYRSIRTTYYTSVVGDKDKINHVKQQIHSLELTPRLDTGMPNNIFPEVFKKEKKQKKSKGVDIKMTVDILSNVYMNNVDAVYIFSGDGDYEPVIDQVRYYGKNVYLAAFSSGLNKKLTYKVDKYYHLDHIYFTPESIAHLKNQQQKNLPVL